MKSEIVKDIKDIKQNSIIIDLDKAVEQVYLFMNETKKNYLS